MLSSGDFNTTTCGKQFGGCFAMDELERIKPKPRTAYVANTDDRADRGVHWVCCVFGDDLTCYMDSYGAPPPVRMADFMKRADNPILYNTAQVQSLESDVCGLHCIGMIRALTVPESGRGRAGLMTKFNDYIYGFDIHDLDANDERIRQTRGDKTARR